MLRITTSRDDETTTIKLEGTLASIWVDEVRKCTRGALPGKSLKEFAVDLTDVTFVDNAGKRLLANLADSGARLISADPMMNALVEEIATRQKTTACNNELSSNLGGHMDTVQTLTADLMTFPEPQNTLSRDEIAVAVQRHERGRVLVVMDESPSAIRALKYAAELVNGLPDFGICLAHPLPPLPPEFYELTDREKDQPKWKADAMAEAKRLCLDPAVAKLKAAGMPESSISVEFFDGETNGYAAEAILSLADHRDCAAIVIGQDAQPWWRGLFGHDLAEELARHSKGFTIWKELDRRGKGCTIWMVQDALPGWSRQRETRRPEVRRGAVAREQIA